MTELDESGTHALKKGFMNEKILKYKGKQIMFLFDTNIYRNIARMAKEDRIKGHRFVIDEMKRREKQNTCTSIMSLTTSQELLAHLIIEDKETNKYIECYNALRFQFFHTQVLQPAKRIPSIDSLLDYFFYDNDSIQERLIISEHVYNVIRKIFIQSIDMDVLEHEIGGINQDFACYKKEFYMLFESLLTHPQNGNNDWLFFRGDKKLNAFIKNQDYVGFIGNYLIQRSKYLSDKNLNKEISDEKTSLFYSYFKEALLEFKYLFEILRDNGDSLKVLEGNEKWNAVMDFHLVFEWCFVRYFNRNKGIEVVLVTEEHCANFKELHSRDDVWFMNEYFEFMGFTVDKINPKKPLLQL